ncbi:MAG TPA: peptidyl-prolyl cis-trans isomerase [Bryobacteraceae bacterium]|nr:peptidyl-prolyl cis-trans isomerase [Bryobacteraceae bacterium]
MFSFNIFRSRQTATRILMGAFLLVVAASMLTYLTQTGLTSSADNDTVLAQVGPSKITVQETQNMVERAIRANQLQADTVDIALPSYVDQIMQERAALYVFANQGLKVSDEEVLTGLMEVYPQFFQNGKLTQRDAFEQQLGATGLTLADAVDAMRDQLLMRKIQNMIFDTVVVTPQEVDESILKKHQRAKIVYVDFPAAKFTSQVKPTPEELSKYFEANKAGYSVPEKRAFQVVVVDQAKVEQSLTVSDAQLRAAYSTSMDNFRTPERVKVRHILFMTQGKPDSEKKTQLTKAQGVLKQLRAGGDFAELAKKNSEDPGSAPKGGDLGFIVRGQTVPDFEKVAFSAKINDISDIITTEYGYHIIQVQGKEAARVVPFEEVKDKIAAELKKQGVGDKMQSLADQAHAALVKAPGSATEVAKQLGLELIAATTSRGQAVPGLGVAREIDDALGAMKPMDVSAPLTLPANRLGIVVLNDRIPSKPAQYADVEERVRQAFVTGTAQNMASAEAKSFAEKASAGGDLEALAKAAKLDIVKSEFGVNDSVEGLGPASYVLDSFLKPVGAVIGPVVVQGRNIVYKIVSRVSPDIKDYANERETELANLKKQKAKDEYDLIMDSVMAQLRADKKIVVHPDTLKKLAATYRQNR